MRPIIFGAGIVVLALGSSAARSADPAPPPPVAVPLAAPVTLGACLAFARAHAPGIIAAQSQRGLARAAALGVRGPFVDRPVLEAAIGPRWDGGETGETGVDFEIGLAQRIEIGGQRGARARAAARLGDRVEAERAEIEGAVLVEVARAHRAAALARAEEALAARREALARETLALVARRVEGGEEAAVAAQIAEVEAAEAMLQRALTRDRAEALERGLAIVMGWSLETPPAVGAAVPESLPSLEEVLQLAPAPAVRVARALADEARARASLAGWLNAPAPTFGVTVMREAAPVGDASWVVLGTVALELPFTTPDPEGPARARAESVVADAEADRRAGTTEAEIRSAYLSAVTAARRVAEIDQTMSRPLAGRLAVLDRAFARGHLNLLDLATARARLLAADQARLTALGALAEALGQLERALGRPLAFATLPPAETSP